MDLTTVHGISCEAIYFPAHDSLRLAVLDAGHHLTKDRPAGHLCAPFLHKLLYDFKPLFPRERAQFAQLRFDRQNLFVLDIGAFAGVKEVAHIQHWLQKIVARRAI